MAQGRLSPSLLALSLLVRGVGQGAIGVPSMSAAYISVPREQLALATTASNIVQRLGGPTATTIVGMVLSFSASHFAGSGVHAFTLAFVALIGLQVILLGSAGRLPIRIQSNRPHGPAENEN
jgi:hypothetical protein